MSSFEYEMVPSFTTVVGERKMEKKDSGALWRDETASGLEIRTIIPLQHIGIPVINTIVAN